MLILMTIVATGLGVVGYFDALKRSQVHNRTLATEFLSSHGIFTRGPMGDYWDLSGIDDDLKVHELNLLRYLDESQRTRIISIDFSGTNVTDNHLAFIDSLPLLHQIDLRGTKVTESIVGHIYTSPRFPRPTIAHDFENCYWFSDGSWANSIHSRDSGDPSVCLNQHKLAVKLD